MTPELVVGYIFAYKEAFFLLCVCILVRQCSIITESISSYVAVICPPWSLTVVNRDLYNANTRQYIASMNSSICKILRGLYKHCFMSWSTTTRMCWNILYLLQHFRSFITKSNNKSIHFLFEIDSELKKPCFWTIYAFVRLHVEQFYAYCLQCLTISNQK